MGSTSGTKGSGSNIRVGESVVRNAGRPKCRQGERPARLANGIKRIGRSPEYFFFDSPASFSYCLLPHFSEVGDPNRISSSLVSRSIRISRNASATVSAVPFVSVMSFTSLHEFDVHCAVRFDGSRCCPLPPPRVFCIDACGQHHQPNSSFARALQVRNPLRQAMPRPAGGTIDARSRND